MALKLPTHSNDTQRNAHVFLASVLYIPGGWCKHHHFCRWMSLENVQGSKMVIAYRLIDRKGSALFVTAPRQDITSCKLLMDELTIRTNPKFLQQCRPTNSLAALGFGSQAGTCQQIKQFDLQLKKCQSMDRNISVRYNHCKAYKIEKTKEVSH